MSMPRLVSAVRIAVGCLALAALALVVAGPLGASATATKPTPTTVIVRSTVVPTSVPPTSTPLPVPPPTQVAATSTPVPQTEPMDPPELRAVWVDAFHDGFKTPAQVDELLAWARAANLNALFVQVRRRGDAYYLKSFEPRAEDPDFAPGFDALQYLIDRAHQGPQPLQVHAWLATLPIWHERDTPPGSPNHAFNVHGPTADPAANWLMTRDDGEIWAGVGKQGIYYLDPGNPEAARYTVDVYLNLIRNYAVDGIHLDQVRYYEGQPPRWGYNPASV